MSDNKKELREAVRFHAPEEGWTPMHDAVTIDVTKKSPEYRQYLVLIWNQNTGENTFIIAEGRSDTYFAIKEIIDLIDVEKSIVMMEGNRILVDHITVLQFLRHVRDEELVEDETGYIIDEVLAEMEGV